MAKAKASAAAAIWSADTIKVVYFLTSTGANDAEKLFVSTFGREPEQTQRNRVPLPGSPFFTLAAGEHENRMLDVQVAPGRIDYNVAAFEADPALPFGNLLSVENELPALIGTLTNGGSPSGDIYRMSIVTTCLRPVETLDDAAQEFFRSIGVKQYASATDLTFQMNLRRQIGERSVNRILQLSTLAKQSVHVPAPPQGGSAVASVVAGYAARRQFDINTVPDGKLFNVDEQIATLKFLMDETFALASKGTLEGLAN